MSEFHVADTGAESQFILAVGAVVTSANLTDLGLCALYVALLNSDVAGAVAFGQPFAVTVQACRAAINYYPDDPLNQSALDAITHADALYKQRNQVAHGIWSGDTDEHGLMSNWQVKRWGKQETSQWSVSTMFQLAADLVAAGGRLREVGEAFTAAREDPVVAAMRAAADIFETRTKDKETPTSG